MNQTTDCVIVGAGLIGMLSARELLLSGMAVTLVDQGAAGKESSWAGGGILSPLHPWRAFPAVTALASWSQAFYPQLAAALQDATGIDPQWTPSGLLILDPQEHGQALAWAGETGQTVQVLDADACRRLAPGLGFLPAQSLWLPQVAQVRNPRLLKALRQDLVQRGGLILTQTEVVEIRQRGGRVQGVRTPQGRLTSPRVVVAGGAWSSRILQQAGISVEIEPVRGQMLLYRTEPGLLSPIILQDQYYLIPRRDGHILVGSTMEYQGFNKVTTEAAREKLQQAARRLLPALADYPLHDHWAGLRPGNRRGVPLIGPVPGIDGLYINSGHFRNGVGLGPASARLLADIVCTHDEMIVDPAPYRLS